MPSSFFHEDIPTKEKFLVKHRISMIRTLTVVP